MATVLGGGGTSGRSFDDRHSIALLLRYFARDARQLVLPGERESRLLHGSLWICVGFLMDDLVSHMEKEKRGWIGQSKNGRARCGG